MSVGIGLGLQSVVNNFVSGLILLWERAIRVGDWVLIGSDQGYVRKISVRATEIETFDRATMIVPNGQMVTGVVKNFVRTDRVGRIEVPVQVIWGTDPERVREVLIEAAKSQEEVVGIPAPAVLFSRIHPDVSRLRTGLFRRGRRAGGAGEKRSALRHFRPLCRGWPANDPSAGGAADDHARFLATRVAHAAARRRGRGGHKTLTLLAQASAPVLFHGILKLPHKIAQKMLLGVAACLLLAGCAESFRPQSSEAGLYQSMMAPGAQVDALAARDMISLYRSNHGLKTLAVDPGLMAEAQRQADAMASADKLSHEVRGSLTDRLDHDGYEKFAAVENVSAGYDTLSEVFSGWRQSPPHNANMLASGMRRMGIAAAYNSKTRYKVFWALVLAN